MVDHSVDTNLLASQCSSETQPREVIGPTALLMLRNNNADIVSTLFRSSDVCIGLWDEYAFSILRPLDMVSLNIANAFAPINAVENGTSCAKQNKVAAMAKIISDIMKIRSTTTSEASNVPWVTSIIALTMILGHEVYHVDIFMHHLTEAFLCMIIHEKQSIHRDEVWFTRLHASLDHLIRTRDVLNIQKVINWNAFIWVQNLHQGRNALLVLLKARKKIAPDLINLALSTWDGEMVETFLEYNSVNIDNEVIRFVAGNIKHGKQIMEILLAREIETVASETAHETTQ